MSRPALLSCILVLLVCVPSHARTQSQSLDELHRQAEDAYCSRDFANAVELSRAAAELAKSDIARQSQQIARMARASEKLGDRQGAERYYRQLLGNYEREFGKDSLNSAFAMEALARILTRNGKIDEAEALFQRVPPARNRELMQWAEQFRVAKADVPDVFKSRHHANKGLIAAKRRQWRTAFHEYQQSMLSIDDNVSQINSGDSLADLSSEANTRTFVGLARASWELGKEPGADAAALLAQSFEALQRKWRTAAALALQKAAERVPRVGQTGAPPPSARTKSYGNTRKAQDREERLRALEAEQEDVMQSWFAKRDADPAFKAAWDAEMDANRKFAAMDPKERSRVEKVLQEMWGRCTSRRPPCNLSMHDALAKYGGQPWPEPSSGATYADRLAALERKLPGFEEYERRSNDLRARIAALGVSGPANTVTTPQRKAPAPSQSPLAAVAELSVGEVQALLRDDEALLVHLVGDEDGFVWAITRSNAVWKPISIDSAYLDNAVGTLRLGLEPPAGTGATSSADSGRAPFSLPLAHELYSKLIAPVEGVIASKRHLLIVPTGVLTGLPFHVLVTRKPSAGLGELDGYRKADWLVRKHAVSTLPGVSSLRSLRARSHVQAALAFLGFGDPNYERTAPNSSRARQDLLATVARCSRSKHAAAGKLQRLPDTAKEVQFIGKTWGAGDGEIFVGEAAGEARLRSMHERGALFNYRVLYFATHGLVTGELDGLLEPALALTAAPGNDGLLTATEIAQLQLNADLVVLSACNTASERRPGEETLSGLARAFLYAGARALLVSHWPVDSFATTQLMTKMFKRSSDAPERGRAEALKQAMIEIIDQGDIVGAHPSYWAPFVVVGEGMN